MLRSLAGNHLNRFSLSCVPWWLVVLVGGLLLASFSGCGDQSAVQSTPSIDRSDKLSSNSSDSVPISTAANNRTEPITGHDLYLQHCAACHGESGDGKGIAARFLYPKPRDFRSGRFRLVSTDNSVPCREDLLAVLQRGMPGSAMPSWAHLSDQERNLLVDEILRMRKEGLREQIIARLKDNDDEIVESEVQAEIDRKTTPGLVVEVSNFAAADEAAIARGKQIYLKQGCASCHGNEGRGDGQQTMVDAEGLPTRPRDFTLGIFKGSDDSTSVYRRIALGMPGTPMPSSSNLTTEQKVDLTQYILSLSTPPIREAMVLKRNRIIAHYAPELPAQPDANAWTASNETSIRLAPLWWRGDVDPDLHVEAMHDGHTLAVRLRWRDATPNWNVARTESFKDAAAMELYRGNREPFIGMGGPQAPIDVWFWDADRQRLTSPPQVAHDTTQTTADGTYPNMAVDMYPFSESKGPGTAEYHRPGTELANQPPVSMPAAAVGNQIVPPVAAVSLGDKSGAAHGGGSSLAAGGPGSATFRPPISQSVDAIGQWNDGQWCVVFRRSLTAGDGEGVALSQGERTSVGFAIWDGARGDRNGQKMVSIWQDLLLEKGSQ